MWSRKTLDWLPGEHRHDELPTETKDIHLVILDALMSGEVSSMSSASIPGTLLASIDAPTPLPQSAIRPPISSRAAALAIMGMMKLG